jgi:predicted deacylase
MVQNSSISTPSCFLDLLILRNLQLADRPWETQTSHHRVAIMQLNSRTFAGRSGPRLLITGGVHGDEFEPMAAIRQLIRYFDRSPELAGKLTGSVQLVPVVNQAAFLRGHRTAEDQLDLARTCPGNSAGSVTQRVAAAVTELIQQSDAYIDLHTGGTELSVQPLTGYHLVADANILATQRRMAHAFNLPFIWGTSAKTDGRTLSVARSAGVPAIYAEYLGSATMSPRGVEAYVEGCLNVMAELGIIDRDRPPSQVEHVVEDNRPESGHMQVCNPSPITGFFESAVNLGARVKQGQLLGTVCSELGDDVREIAAETDGIVLVLRTFPRVKQGETLGVIAELHHE